MEVLSSFFSLYKVSWNLQMLSGSGNFWSFLLSVLTAPPLMTLYLYLLIEAAPSPGGWSQPELLPHL